MARVDEARVFGAQGGDMPGPVVCGDRAARGLAESPADCGIGERSQHGSDRFAGGRVRLPAAFAPGRHEGAGARREPFRGTVAPRRHDRQPGCGGFEGHVGEGVVAGREQQAVDGGIDALEIAPRPEEAHSIGDAGPRRAAAPGRGIIAPGDPEARAGVAETRDRGEGLGESLASPARGGEEPDPLRIRVESPAQTPAGGAIAIGIEALGIDGVRQEQDALARDRFTFLEAIGDEPRGALDALGGIGEDGALDREQAPMPGQQAAQAPAEARMHAFEIVRVAAAAGAIQILVARATEAVDDIETARLRRPGRGSGEVEGPKGTAPTGGGDGAETDSLGGLGRASDDRHVLSLASELPGDLPGYVLDSTGARCEAFDDECDAQGATSIRRVRISAKQASVIHARGALPS